MYYLWYTLEFEGDILVAQFDKKPTEEQVADALVGYKANDAAIQRLLNHGEVNLSYYIDMKLDTEGPEECE